MAEILKEINPQAITVQGGTNFPHKTEEQKAFLLRRPNTDVFVELEGEVAFANLIGKVLEYRENNHTFWGQPIPGCLYIVPETKKSNPRR